MLRYEREIEILVKAGTRVIEVASYEWQRVHGFINEVAEVLGYNWYTWSSVFGIKRWTAKGFKTIDSTISTLSHAMEFYLQANDDMLLIVEDFHPHAEAGQPHNIRYIREMMRPQSYGDRHEKKVIILSSPNKFIPDELSKELPIVEVDLPDVDTLREIAESVAKHECSKECIEYDLTTKLLQSALGLTVMEARLAFAKAIINKRQLTEEEIPLIIKEKEQIIKKSGLLEYYHHKEDLQSVGGLDNLKDWIKKRGYAYSEEAQNFGLTIPRGVLLLGVPGCGKSMTAKAIANEGKVPLLRFDLGKVYGGILGESERNIRYALDVAKTISPCVLWIDEIEKGLSGSVSSGSTDGGTSARVLATFLTWMQEKEDPVFVVATANDISQLPVELLRKGRFDEIFFVDLPSSSERTNIFKIHLKNKGRDTEKLNINIELLAKASEGFSGAEIEEVVSEALYLAFDNKQKNVTEADLLECIENTCPLSKTMSETIMSLRKWAAERARLASVGSPAVVKRHADGVPILEQEFSNPFIKRSSK